MTSSKSNGCAGDSGSPILNITATQVTLVGIYTGGVGSGNCTIKSSDGNYYALFTLIGRYANLAFSAATDVMNAQSVVNSEQLTQLTAKDALAATYKSTITNLNSAIVIQKTLLDGKDSEISSLNSRLNSIIASLDVSSRELMTAKNDLFDLQAQVDAAQVTIEALNRKLPQTISCVKGNVTKKVTALKPSCPAGYKKK
jgi:hypothetical protein